MRQPAVVRLLIARGTQVDRKDSAGDLALLDAPDLETALARIEKATRRAFGETDEYEVLLGLAALEDPIDPALWDQCFGDLTGSVPVLPAP